MSSSLANVGLGLTAALTPTAGWTAAVVHTFINDPAPTLVDVARLGAAGLMVWAVTVPLIKWVLARLDKVSDALSRAERKKAEDAERQATKEMEEIRHALMEIRELLHQAHVREVQHFPQEK